MQRMWSPWRSRYIATFTSGKKRKMGKASLFTSAWRSADDARNLIVWRGTTCFVIMNRFPYNSGHVMVVPYRQVADIQDLTLVELAEMMQTVQRSIRALDAVMRPDGYNLGANLGRVAGAGIADHLHFHVVPRWTGDTNFMPTLADTKVISEEIRSTQKKLQKAMKMAGN
jgi:ATP adenylyltransferase